MSNWHIHRFEKSPSIEGISEACYFITRPFGNYLIFPWNREPHDWNEDKSFMESKGGLANQFVFSLSKPNLGQKTISDYFGAPLTYAMESAEFLEHIKKFTEVRYVVDQVDFYDHNSAFVMLEENFVLFIKQNENSFAFLPSPFINDRGTIRLLGTKTRTIETHEIRTLLPWKSETLIAHVQAYRGQSFIELPEKDQ